MSNVTFDLSEFDRHGAHLQEVSAAVSKAQQSARAAMDSNGQAFGLLFGWAVAPVLNAVCGGVGTYSSELGQLLSTSASGISRDKASYSLTETDNVEAAHVISTDVAAGPAVT